MKFFRRGKSDSYIVLHEALSELNEGQSLSKKDMYQTIRLLQGTKKLLKSSSFGRLPSDLKSMRQ